MIPRLVHALQFEITPSPGMHRACLVIWPDHPSRKARPVRRNQDWLEVAAGDETFVAGKRRTDLEVRVYRSTRGFEGEPVVRCGREWLLQRDADANEM